MAVEIIKSNEIQLTNSKLKAFTEQIFKQGLNIKKAFAKVATILVKIDDSKCYEQDGFESVQDYALQVFGWKKATTYAMLRIGREYIDGKTLESVLPHEIGNDYSNSQLQALLPLKSVETAKKLAEKDIINPEMTVKEIKKVVKDYKGCDKSESDRVEGSENSANESVNEENEAVEARAWEIVHTIEMMKDADGNIFFMFDGAETTKEAIIEALNLVK